MVERKFEYFVSSWFAASLKVLQLMVGLQYHRNDNIYFSTTS